MSYGIRKSGFDFTKIQNMVDAAQALDTAGQTKECESVLTILAEEILNESN